MTHLVYFSHSTGSGCCCLVAKLCPTLCNPMDCSPPGSSSMEFPRQKYWSGLPFPSPRESSPPRDWTPGFCISCSGRGILLPLSSQGSPSSGYSLKLFAHFVEVCLIPQGCAPWCGGLFSGSCVRSCMRSFPFMGLYKYIQLVDFFCSIPRLSTTKHHDLPPHLSIPVPPIGRFYPQ